MDLTSPPPVLDMTCTSAVQRSPEGPTMMSCMRILHPAGTASAFLRQHGNSIQRNTKEVDSPGSEHYDLATLVSSSAPLFVSFGDPKSSRSSKSSRSQTRDPKMATLDPKTVRLVPKTGLNPFRICVLPSKTAADGRTHDGRTNGRTHMKNLRHSHNRPFGQLSDIH